MKLKIYFLSALLILIIVLPASAKKWRVNNTLDVPTQVDYKQLKAAVEDDDNVLSGDTIYVEASGVPYEGGIQVYKRLTIIGPGYLLGQAHIQPSVCGTQNSATIGGEPGISLNAGSDGTFITGLTFISGNVTPISISIQNTSNITIARNRMEDFNFPAGTSLEPNNINGISITRNLIENDLRFGCHLFISNLDISFNLIRGSIEDNCPGSSINLEASGSIQYNTLFSSSYIWADGCDITYNLTGVIDAIPADNGAIEYNRLALNNTTNQAIVDWSNTNIIDPYNTFNINNWGFHTDDWALDEQPDIDTIHGAHNGWNPINPNNFISKANLPAWPTIYGCTVQPCADSILQVIFQVRTNF
ncbi:MAG: hypothetical protein ACI8VT_004107 [Saprospiraceae bacterium]|jgi:hypothetical protein